MVAWLLEPLVVELRGIRALVDLHGKRIAQELREQRGILRGLAFATRRPWGITLETMEQRGMQFQFGVKVRAACTVDAVKAKVIATLASGAVHAAEALLDAQGEALLTSPLFVASKNELVQLRATLFDEDDNPSQTVEEVGVVRDTIGPAAPVLAIETLAQIPDSGPEPKTES